MTDGSTSYSDAVAAEESGLTLLWGTWELWCDLPQNGSGSNANTTTDSNAVGPHGRGMASGEKQNWLNQVKSIGLFDSAEGFWGLLNCILLPSQLPPNGSYYLFRKLIAPMWEHEANRRGGKWVIPFVHASTAPDAVSPAAAATLPVDVAWQKMCLAAIGEHFPGDEMEICGITISRNKSRVPGATPGEWKLCLWTRNADNKEVQMSIAQHVRELLNLRAAATPSTSPSKTLAEHADPSESKERREDGEGSCMVFMAHRALMEAKQKFAQGSHPSQPFRPLYSI